MISTLSLLLVLINAINGQVHLNRSNLAQLCKYNISSTYIDLSKQKIVSIDANTFQGLSNLKSLNLFSNPLRSIDANAFQGLSNLEELNLRGHELRSIDANTFQGLSNIKWLYFAGSGTWSKISSIDANLFQGLTKLVYLDLRYNQILSFDRNALVGLNELKKVCLFDHRYGGIVNLPFPDLSGICATNIKCKVDLSKYCDQ